MSFEPNKGFHLIDSHTGKGLGYEVYASYDYIREVSQDNNKGSVFTFEEVENEYDYKIRIDGGHWDDYNYLTMSGKGWVYLDSKANATNWSVDDNFGTGLLKLSESGLKREERHLGYTQSGEKKWLSGKRFENRKGFKLVAAD
ncbi:hypothetical protein ACS78_27905 [Priestia megaterium]|uniref:hypothetical protein n=1 Tax=Priestia megaterium TaxID=1404 RepID=UPI00067FFE9F|nr:hypothetical protein [Priestia megaterium]KNH12644.1 hypothetical protein ACS78_27905 [Priestia megaterium]